MYEKTEMICPLCYSKYGTGFPQRIPRELDCRHTFCTGESRIASIIDFWNSKIIFKISFLSRKLAHAIWCLIFLNLSVENMQSPKVKTVRKFNFIRKKRLGTRILALN